jgi:hypothetical protein
MIHALGMILALTTSGTWSMQAVNGQYSLETRWSDTSGDNNVSDHEYITNAVDLGISNIAGTNGHVTFKQHHEAGDYAFEGWLSAGNGGGTYIFTTNDAFFNDLARRGYSFDSLGQKMAAANLDITTEYVNSIESAGFHVDAHKLITFKALRIDQRYLSDLKSAGINDLSDSQVVSLKALKVDLAYIRDLDSVGFGHMSAHEYVTFKAMKIDSAYIKYLTAHGFKNLTPNQVVTMKAMKV